MFTCLCVGCYEVKKKKEKKRKRKKRKRKSLRKERKREASIIVLNKYCVWFKLGLKEEV